MQGELASAQEALKAARTESTRRLRELQSLQGAASGAPPGGAAAAAAALATETAAREAAEGKLREVKAALVRKKQLVTDLRKRVQHHILILANLRDPDVPQHLRLGAKHRTVDDTKHCMKHVRSKIQYLQ